MAICQLTALIIVISIHALRKECDFDDVPLEYPFQISIHALRKECDSSFPLYTTAVSGFLSTHSVRSATLQPNHIDVTINISIHALRKECDQRIWHDSVFSKQFLSTHSVRSATRLITKTRIHLRLKFLSTHSVRSAT